MSSSLSRRMGQKPYHKIGTANSRAPRHAPMSPFYGIVNSHIGARARSRRLQLGLSEELVSARIELKIEQIAQYESGTVELTMSQLVRLAQLLHVSPAYFYAGLPDGPLDRFRLH
jgi:ribosome-binding protein aMBF1 (putative translation factor)